MKTVQFLLGLLIGFHAFGQSLISISGKVVNEEKGAPMPFATIGVAGSPHGTISNTDGAFNFYLPSSYLKDTLSISYVGFETYREVIQKIQNPVTIPLAENVIVLEEVEVNGEQLTANQIVTKALDKLKENYFTQPITLKGFFRDIRTQNGETVSLTEAALDIQEMAITASRRFFIRGLRASHSRINTLLAGSALNAGNSLTVNMGSHFWLNSLKHRVSKVELEIEDVVFQNNEVFYLITSNETVSKGDLAKAHEHLKYRLVHRYLVHSETYAIHKVEHLEYPIEGKYVGIEGPYKGDSLFYSKKGWNQTLEFEEYEGKLFLKYHDVSYTFDIVDEKNDRIYLDMAYDFTFTTTEIETNRSQIPTGIKMNKNKPLALQAKGYDQAFWEDPNNAKLVPLTQKQVKDLEKNEPLEAQFQAKKTKLGKSKSEQGTKKRMP